MLSNLYYKDRLKKTKTEKDENRIQEVIRVHKNYCVYLRNLIPSLYPNYGLISPKIKRIKPVKEIAVPQTSLTSTNLRTATSHIDSVDRHFDFI